MKLLIDGVIYESYPGHGIARMFNEVVPHMARLGLEIEVGVRRYVSPNRIGPAVLPYVGWVPHVRPRLRPWRLWNPLSNVINRWLERWYWMSRSCDVFISTYYTQRPVATKRVCIVYDMIHEMFPEFIADSGYQETIRRKETSILGADAVICISEQTKQDVIRITGVKESRCRVVYLGVNEEQPGRCDLPLELGCRSLLLYVGDYRAEYKNFEFILRNLGQAARDQLSDYALVVATRFEPTERELARFTTLLPSSRLHFCIGATDEMVHALYARCSAFLYPSLYEGFGLPVLEALNVGAPVVCSNAAALPEVGGSVVCYFDPRSDAEFSSALHQALSEGRREDLVCMRQAHARTFTWKRTAAQIVDIVREVATNDGRGCG
jgi:glycosyltransferase involved in cell wall biosynthesis